MAPAVATRGTWASASVASLGCIVFIACAAVVAGCGPAVAGSGNVTTEARRVSGFSQVWLSGSGDVRIEQTGVESLTVEADDNILPLIETRVQDGRLTLGTKDNVSIRPSRAIIYRVTVKELTAAGISGSGKIRAEKIAAPALKAAISGSGSMVLSGRADRIEFNLSGSGSLDAAGLLSHAARVAISGSGGAVVNADGEVLAEISGSGSVEYLEDRGRPSVRQHVSGSGSVRPAKRVAE